MKYRPQPKSESEITDDRRPNIFGLDGGNVGTPDRDSGGVGIFRDEHRVETNHFRVGRTVAEADLDSGLVSVPVSEADGKDGIGQIAVWRLDRKMFTSENI